MQLMLKVALATLLLVAAITGRAQSQMPDIVGFRPGLPAAEAYQLLKKYAGANRSIIVGHQNLADLSATPIIHELQMSEGNAGDSAEVLELDLTLPPQPQRVWRVVRRVRFLSGQEILAAPLVADLRKKYGSEVHPLGPTTAGVWWIDAKGMNVPLPADMKCDGVGPQGWIDEGIQYTVGAGTQRSDLVLPLPVIDIRFSICRTLTRVAALVQLAPQRELANMFMVQMADLSIEASSHAATTALLAERAQGRGNQVLKRAAEQPKPKL